MSRWASITVTDDPGTGLPVLVFSGGNTVVAVPLDGQDVPRAADALASWERENACTADAALDENGKGTVIIGGTVINVRKIDLASGRQAWHAYAADGPGWWYEDASGDSLEEVLTDLLAWRQASAPPGADICDRMIRAFSLAGPAPRQSGPWKNRILREMVALAEAGAKTLSERGWDAVLSGFYDVAYAAGKRTGNAPVTAGPDSGAGAGPLPRAVSTGQSDEPAGKVLETGPPSGQ